MKRYAVFAFNKHYPSWWIEDFQGSFDTMEEATKFETKNLKKYDVVQIIDINTYF